MNADALDVADLSNGLNDELRARVKGELEPGERLLWAGGRLLRRLVPGRGDTTSSALAAMALLSSGRSILLMRSVTCPRGIPDDGSIALGSIFCVVGAPHDRSGSSGAAHSRRDGRGPQRKRLLCGDRSTCHHLDSGAEIPMRIRVHTDATGHRSGASVRVQRPDGSGDLEFCRHRRRPSTDFGHWVSSTSPRSVASSRSFAIT